MTENVTPENEVPLDVDKAVKDYCVEMSASMIRSEAEKDFRREATANISEKTMVSKQVLAFCARTYHKQDFDDKTQRTKEQTDFYIKLFGEPMEAIDTAGDFDENE